MTTYWCEKHEQSYDTRWGCFFCSMIDKADKSVTKSVRQQAWETYMEDAYDNCTGPFVNRKRAYCLPCDTDVIVWRDGVKYCAKCDKKKE